MFSVDDETPLFLAVKHAKLINRNTLVSIFGPISLGLLQSRLN